MLVRCSRPYFAIKSATNASTDSITYVCRLTYAHITLIPFLFYHVFYLCSSFSLLPTFERIRTTIVIIINFILVSCKTICKRTNKFYSRQIGFILAQMHKCTMNICTTLNAIHTFQMLSQCNYNDHINWMEFRFKRNGLQIFLPKRKLHEKWGKKTFCY